MNLGIFDFLKDVGNYETRKVDRFESEGLFVSTAAVSDSCFPYETAVRHRDYNNGQIVIVESYSSKENAILGHKKWVKTMTTEPLPAELRDVLTSNIGQLLKQKQREEE